MVLLAPCYDKHLRNTFIFFVLNLAITDLGVALTAMWFYTVDVMLGYWPFGEVSASFVAVVLVVADVVVGAIVVVFIIIIIIAAIIVVSIIAAVSVIAAISVIVVVVVVVTSLAITSSLAKEVMFLVALVSLSVCLSVDNITQKVMNGLE